MRSPINELYERFRSGLETSAGPADPLFSEVWETYYAVTGQASNLLLLEGSVDGADEVELYRARFSRVGSISAGMPLRIPTPSAHSVRAMGRLFEDRASIDDIGDFLALSSPIVNDLGAYCSTQLGRLSQPVLEALTVTAKAATIMNHCVISLVPGFSDREAKI